MPDLDFQVEVGPELEIEFARNEVRGSWFISPQLRPSFVFDSLVPSYQGLVFSPELIYKKKLQEGEGDIKVSLMPTLATAKYMDFFYTVDPMFATPTRPAYKADGGYLGTDLTARWKSAFKNNFAYVAGVRVSFYQGAANKNSPLYTQETTFSVFGEGVDEETVCIGDEFRVGHATVVVTEPRMPCYKLGIRFGRADMVKRFLRSQRTGFYFGVVEEGQVQAGDELLRLNKHPDGFPVADVTRLYTTEKANTALLSKAISVSALPESWRGFFAHQLEKLR